MKMRRSRTLFAVPLLILLLFDLSVAFALKEHGWPKYIEADDSGLVHMVRIPTSWTDLLAVSALLCAHVLLIYGNRRAWHLPHQTGK
jgi:hypothetical protein